MAKQKLTAKFPMVNDQSGETVEATLNDEAQKRAEGFRIQVGGAYDAALAERAELTKVELPAGEPTGAALQTRSDAALAAQRTFPAADLGDDGKDAPTEEPTDEAAGAAVETGPFSNPVEAGFVAAEAAAVSGAAATLAEEPRTAAPAGNRRRS